MWFLSGQVRGLGKDPGGFSDGNSGLGIYFGSKAHDQKVI